MIIFSINDIKKKFEEYKCILISEFYENKHTQLEFLCEFEHKNKRSYKQFIESKFKCKICYEENKKKYTFQEVKKILENLGYELLSTEYKNIYQKLKCICPKKHNTEISLNKLLNKKQNCIMCSEKPRATIDSLKKEFFENDCKLLSTIYNPKEKLHYICKNNHECYSKLQDWRRSKYKCFNCGKNATNDKNRTSFEDIVIEMINIGYILLTTKKEYLNFRNNTFEKIKFQCNNHHINEMTYRSLKQKNKCSICT